MVDIQEEDFPRGGTRARASVKRPKEDDNLFSATMRHKSKKQRKDKKAAKQIIVTEESFHYSLKIQGTLSYNSIRTDMIILGCIRKVTPFSLEVELPGLTFGHVTLTNISDPFTKYLSSKLEQDGDGETFLTKMFAVGQFLLTKVTNIGSNDKSIRVECTINPREIYNEKFHNSFEKGLLVWASVQSELEHGYEMNIGVKNCRVFLPSKNVEKDRTLFIGQPIWCTIHKCESSNVASTLRVSCTSEHINKSKIEDVKSLHDVIPGMQIEMVVEKLTNTGVQGKFLNDFFGHIDEGQLMKPLSKYQEGNLLTAYVLYVDHTVKVTYLTTYDLDLVPSPNYKVGDIVIAEVVSKAHNGVHFKLDSKEKCFITNRRLVLALPKQYTNLDITDSIRLKYAPGTRHSCRILDYNHISRTYVGTVEQTVLKEKLFSTSDLKIGQLLDVTIKSAKADGLVVTAGHVTGFVPNLYLSNVIYSDNIKKKFKEGVHTKARVLNVRDGNAVLTLKSNQVDSEQCLTDLSQAKRGDRYPGVIIQTKPSGALVVFYGNVKGWISKRYLDEQKDDQKPDPQLFFYIGQVVNPWVVFVKPDKVILSLRQPKDFDTSGSLAVGQKVSGVVGTIRKDRLFVKTTRGKPVGVIPVNHLSGSLSLCPIILKTYNVGDQIDNLICIDNTTSSNTLSRREALALKRTPKLKLMKFQKLRQGSLVRCSYLSECERGIYVLPLILDYTEKILIRKKDIVNTETGIPKFEPHQSVVTKVIRIHYDSKQIRLTTKLSQVFDNTVEGVIGLFTQHLTDIETIRNYGKEKNWEICKYAPGERVSCIVEKLGDKGGCLVKLPNGVQGLVAPRLCPGNISEGDTLIGVFLSQNFVEDYAEICLKSDICQKINKIQDGAITCSNLASCIAYTILKKSDLAIALLKHKDGNRQLVYVPLFTHENDFEGCTKYYDQEKLKICICRKVNNRLIGVSKKLFVTLDKHRASMTNAISQRNIKKHDSSTDVPTTQEASESMEEDANEDDEDIDEDEEEEIKEEVEDITDEEENVEEEEHDSGSDEETSDVEMNVANIIEAPYTTKRSIPSSGNDNIVKVSSDDSITGPPLPILSGVSSFFDAIATQDQDISSDDEVQDTTVKKKKKLTPAERAQLARDEEDRISKIEKQLADSTRTPESAEHFDRLLLANPNSSELWTKYIAFHTAATEFDKARVVAKRALESINITLVDERFNIWIALLNLENLLGTKESFEKTFYDAVKYNDSLQVYLKTIQMLAESGKLTDMEEKISKVRNKHKQVPQMWLDIARTYYQLGKFKDARNMKDAALKSITNKRSQLDIIVKFALMEFKFGDGEHGAAIFEAMLSSDPKKVTVWTTYVDQLVKKNKIEEARQVLERSICHQLPIKNKRTLFLKFRMFEEQHGTPDTLEYVKERAQELLSKVSVK